MSLDDLEKEDKTDLDDPFVKFFRKVILEDVAKTQSSNLYCPYCKTNLPYTQMTVGQEWDGVDANFNPVKKIVFYCSLCDKNFYK